MNGRRNGSVMVSSGRPGEGAAARELLRMIWICYAVGWLFTLLFQTTIRLMLCHGVLGCSGSLLNGLLRAVVWPVYWLARWAMS